MTGWLFLLVVLSVIGVVETMFAPVRDDLDREDDMGDMADWMNEQADVQCEWCGRFRCECSCECDVELVDDESTWVEEE